MRFASFAGLLSKILDSFQSGFVKKALLGAGLTFGSTTAVLTIVQTYIAKVQADANSLPHEVLMLLGLSGLDYALSLVLSAVLSRTLMNSMGLHLKKK